MNIPKRPQSMSDSYLKLKKKLKDILALSKPKCDVKITETDTTNIPFIKQADTAKLLPKYATILAKDGEDGVIMEDLDQLQEDLEKLLSNSAVRIRYLLSEIIELEGSDDDNERKAHDKTSLKRKRPDEKPKSKEQKNGIRFVKKQGLPVNKFVEEANLQELPKVTLPRNDTSDKFWASVEPFCAPIGKDDILFLDNLLEEVGKETDIKIPDLGEQYGNEWSEEVVLEEQIMGKSPTKKVINSIPDIKKFGLHNIVDTFAAPTTQRLLAALLEEKVTEILPKDLEDKIIKQESLEIPEIQMNTGNTQRAATCLDNRLKKELVEQGIIFPEDLEKTVPEDEILTEIKKCQQELITVNEYNIHELNKLKTLATNDLQSNQLKEQLEKVDFQVLELYNKITSARKAAQKEDGEEFDKAVFSEQITREFESQADVLLNQQLELNHQLNGLTDMQMLY